MGHAIELGRGFDRSAEAHFIFAFAPFEFPRVAMNQPVLRQFNLHAIDDLLAEQAMAVADAVAKGRNAEARHAFHEAGRKAAQAAIAQCRIRFQGLNQVGLDAKVLQGGLKLVEQSEIGRRIAQQPPDEEFHRQVVNPLALVLIGFADGGHPLLDHPVAHHEDGGFQPVMAARRCGVLAHGKGQLLDNFAGSALPPLPPAALAGAGWSLWICLVW